VFTTGIMLWTLSALMIVGNLLTGFFLSQSAEVSPILHLILALGSLAFGIIGHFVLSQSSQRLLEEAAVAGSLSDSTRETVRVTMKNAQAHGFVSLGVLVVSIITGTIAHAGRWPIVHILSALFLILLFGKTFILWKKLQIPRP
jgi:hypothetical protein